MCERNDRRRFGGEIQGAEEEGFELSIPRLEVLRVTCSPLFLIVQFSLSLSLILAEGVAPCSSLFVVGWCTKWCKSVYEALDDKLCAPTAFRDLCRTDVPTLR